VDDEFLLFAGSGSRRLGHQIAAYLGCPLGRSEVLRFQEGSLFVRVLENVRGRDVFLIQGTSFPVNDNFVELLFWIDAFKRASATSVTVVIPYFSYAKGDKKDEPRVSIRARVCADAIEAALPRRDTQVRVIVPYGRGDLVARAHADGEVLHAEHVADGTLLEARVPPGLAAQLEAAALTPAAP